MSAALSRKAESCFSSAGWLMCLGELSTVLSCKEERSLFVCTRQYGT